ncbi:unnamed protein product [Oppiella nova]|uniref:Uncharacterized protein n=1 Tax=Oppiella nova TaxID=334625 RepID=A0A7R9QL68_9ACAR|nr:unnamed protein product [Oppiella nova]CAG2168088.1 unnamed protein product [Oppiella nova]
MSNLLTIVSILVVGVVYVSGQGDLMTDEMKKNAKMMLCGTCKDEAVRADIIKFGECVSGHYPEEVAALKAIREANLANPDECVNKMRTQLEGYRKTHADGIVKVMECFAANVVANHLAKCH